MTAYGSVEVAVEAMRRGACDFVEKPWDNERLLTIVRTQTERTEIVRKGRRLEQECRGAKKDQQWPCERHPVLSGNERTVRRQRRGLEAGRRLLKLQVEYSSNFRLADRDFPPAVAHFVVAIAATKWVALTPERKSVPSPRMLIPLLGLLCLDRADSARHSKTALRPQYPTPIGLYDHPEALRNDRMASRREFTTVADQPYPDNQCVLGFAQPG